MTAAPGVVALSGGVGGAKLAFGLAQILSDGDLAVVVNTGDDFEHLGLHVSPDIDTVIYTLAKLNNQKTGWGRANETWSFMSALEQMAAPTWFQLGDRDLALNVIRTEKLRSGMTLSEFAASIAPRFGIRSHIVPMSDDRVSTLIDTNDGTLEFQDYFVRQKCRPVVQQIRYDGAEWAQPSPRFQAVMNDRDTRALIICPSNPYLSIDPILAIPGVRDWFRDSPSPIVAVSPVIAGSSVKGPTSKIMTELGLSCTVVEIANHYRGLINGIVIDESDAAAAERIERMGIKVAISNITMDSVQDKSRLAGFVLSFAEQLISAKD